jgi:DNA repair protein RecN (Recombination protein N)
LGKRADLTFKKIKRKNALLKPILKSQSTIYSHFESNELDYEDDTIKTKFFLQENPAFINDSPVNLQVLQELSFILIDIHSQQQTRELSDENVQFDIIDAIADNPANIQQYQALLKVIKQIKRS